MKTFAFVLLVAALAAWSSNVWSASADSNRFETPAGMAMVAAANATHGWVAGLGYPAKLPPRPEWLVKVGQGATDAWSKETGVSVFRARAALFEMEVDAVGPTPESSDAKTVAKAVKLESEMRSSLAALREAARGLKDLDHPDGPDTAVALTVKARIQRNVRELGLIHKITGEASPVTSDELVVKVFEKAIVIDGVSLPLDREKAVQAMLKAALDHGIVRVLIDCDADYTALGLSIVESMKTAAKSADFSVETVERH